MRTDGWEVLQVSVEGDGRIVLVELDHGKANEMGSAALRDFEALSAELQQDDRAVALITWSRRVSSKGTPIFVAGADVTERGDWSDDRVKAHVRWQRQVLTALREAPVFHVGVVGGVALGWGTEYLLVCDYRIAVPGAVFGLPETGLGILPGAGRTAHLWQPVGTAQALRLGMTGERIKGEEAERIGLVQERATSLEAGLERARTLAGLVARNSPTAVAAFKSALLGAVGGAEAREAEACAYERCVDAGEAAIGRAHFADIRRGARAPWGPKRLED